MTLIELERPAPVWLPPALPVRPMTPAPRPGRPSPAGRRRPRSAIVELPLERTAVARSAGVRMTRRGRLVTGAGALAAAVAVIAGAHASAATQHARPAHGPAVVVVRPGDTLWALAVRADPSADPRVTVARLIKINGLPGAELRPGQALRLAGR